ncbi:hypothetical protein D3C73_1136290 [compost metagenome]
MIAGDQAEQGGFTGAVRADDLPVLAGVNLPVEMIEDRLIVITDHAITQDDERLVCRQRGFLRGIFGFRQRQAIQVFTVGQLSDQCVGHHLLPRALAGQSTVRQYAHLTDKVRHLVKTVEYQHQGIAMP